MDINLIRLRTCMNDTEKRILQEDDYFIENLNLSLSDNDHFLKENVKNSPVTFVFIETGGTEEAFKNKVLGKIPEPYYLISSGHNNSLPASLEIKTFCDAKKIGCTILTGTDEQLSFLVEHIIHVHIVFNDLKENNLGLIGEPSDWLIASKVDPVKLHDNFRFNLVKISMDEFVREIEKHKIEPTFRKKELEEKWKNKEVLKGALEIYGALKRLAKKYSLSGLTVRCFDLLGKYKNTSCLALALLNDEGITAGCEGDVPSLVTMHVMSKLTGMPCFMANPSTINFQDQSLILAHCTIPLKLTNGYTLDTHFESNLGIGIKGEMRPGEITITKICPDLKSIFVSSGEIKENLSLPNYCRTQIKVSLDDGLKDLMEIPFGNHLIISYGDHVMEFLNYIDLALRIYGKKNNKKVSTFEQ